MQTDKKTIGVAGALIAAVVLGAAWFPHAEDPGRSNSAGYRLNLLLEPSGGQTNDWYDAGIAGHTRDGDVLRIVTGPGALQVFTRPLAVFAGRCYAATIRSRATAAGSALAVTDEDVHRILHQLPLPQGGFERHRLAFDSGDYRRISLAIVGGPHIRVVVTSASLLPAPAADCSR